MRLLVDVGFRSHVDDHDRRPDDHDSRPDDHDHADPGAARMDHAQHRAPRCGDRRTSLHPV
jgi:hypothetical protein